MKIDNFFAELNRRNLYKEEALRWLEQSYQDRAGSDPLRRDPRFEALAAKIVPATQFGNKATTKP
jgi:hypothetical protein